MLPVAIHDNDRLSARRDEARQDGCLVAEIPREAKPLHFRIDPPQRLDLLPRSIRAPVVDDQHFEVVAGSGANDLRNDSRQRILFVVRRHHDRDKAIGHGST